MVDSTHEEPAGEVLAPTIEIDPSRRRLWRSGQVVELGDRAMSLLLALARRPGDVMSPDDLLSAAWPGRVVEPHNLRVQVGHLRRQLGMEAIENVTGIGYRLMLEVRFTDSDSFQDLIGRDNELRRLIAMSRQHRLVTLVGAGGVGKTSIARVWHDKLVLGPSVGRGWADLSLLDEPSALLGTLGAALGLRHLGRGSTLSAKQVAEALPAGRKVHLVVDNAEHIASHVAATLQMLLDMAPTLRVVVTSQVPLRLPHEQVFRLSGLDVPEPGASVASMRATGAVTLFVDRCRRADPGFLLDSDNAASVGELCRRVDGLPLALELLAARVPSIGVEGLVQSLDERLSLLDQHPRQGPARQRTLRAALDWTHALLERRAKLAYARLSVFTGPFTLAMAEHVVTSSGEENGLRGAQDLLAALTTLVDASLVVRIDDQAHAYRMLESPRLHALEQLAKSGEEQECRQRLLAWWDHWIGSAPTHELVASLGPIKACLEWALGSSEPSTAEDLARKLAAHPGLSQTPEPVTTRLGPDVDTPFEQLLARFRSDHSSSARPPTDLRSDALLRIARRFKPDEVNDLGSAVRELQRAVDIALRVGRIESPGSHGSSEADLWLDGILTRVAQHTREARFDSSLDEIDDALADIQKREELQAEANRRTKRKLIEAAIQQELLRRDAFSAARRTEALVAVDHPGKPVGTAKWMEFEQRYLDDGANELSTLLLSVGIEMVRLRLEQSTSVEDRLAATISLVHGLRVRGGAEASLRSLVEAVQVGKDALRSVPPGRYPEECSDLRYEIGYALTNLGDRDRNVAHFEEAVDHCRHALEGRSRRSAPLAWALCMQALGFALTMLSQHRSGSDLMKEAEQVFRDALLELSPAKAPLERARTLNQLGYLLCGLSRRENASTKLDEARLAYREAEELASRHKAPDLRARTLTNLAILHLEAAEYGELEAHCREGIRYSREVLTVRTRESQPLPWARTQHNLALLTTKLGTHLGDASLLNEAIDIWRTIGPVLKGNRDSNGWVAGLQESGRALLALSRLTPASGGVSHLREALVALEEALEHCPRDLRPREWTGRMAILTAVRVGLARRTGDARLGQVALSGISDVLTSIPASEMDPGVLGSIHDAEGALRAWLSRGSPEEPAGES